METRPAKLDVFVTNGRKGLFAVVSIAKDEILIDLNGEETPRRSLQIGERKHAFGRKETVGYLNHSCEPNGLPLWMDGFQLPVFDILLSLKVTGEDSYGVSLVLRDGFGWVPPTTALLQRRTTKRLYFGPARP
jgi:hypothetical protein